MSSTIKQTTAQLKKEVQDKIDALTQLAQEYIDENEKTKTRTKLISAIVEKE